jgi:hypothetical protein
MSRIYLADQLALGEDVAQAARTWRESITVLAAVADTSSGHERSGVRKADS